MHVLQRSLLCLLLFISAATVRAQTPTWSSLEHGLGANVNELNSVAFGNGIFVAIKGTLNGGTLHYATSTDGLTWTARTIATSITSSGSAQRVRFLNGKFLIMPIGLSGSAGVALSLTSSDGLTWTSATIGTTTTSPDEMDFGNGRVLAVGSNGYFIGSTDLTTWTAQSTSLGGAFGIQDVAFGGGRWFVTTNGVGEVATSTDGVTFTKVNGLSAVGGFRVEYGNNTWFFYSQQDNAVSTDGVNFTPVTRTPNTTPGGTGTIRFVNDRFLSYGPSTFQASTDGQTWTNFGTFPSLGSGFIFHSIYDFAYGNGKYVAVGSRGFPATAALIFVSDGSTGSGGGDGETGGTFTLAFQVGVDALPGTTTPIPNNLQGYALHNDGIVIAAPNAADTTATLLQHRNGTLSTLLATTGGMPGGGDVRRLELAADGATTYITARSTEVNFAHSGALLKLESGTFTTLIQNSNTLIDRQGFNSSNFTLPSAAGGRLAFIGRRGNDEAYIFKLQGSATTVVAQSEVTVQPNGAGTGKFNRFAKVVMGADGRVFFDGYNAGNFTLPEFRRGLYVEQDGVISVIADSTTLLPGTTTKFNFISSEPIFSVSPDGSKVLLFGANGDHSTESTRHGAYLYANGALSVVADTTTTVNGAAFSYIATGTVTNDGTVIFYGGTDGAYGIFRARNGVVDQFVNGGVPGNTRSPEGLWIHEGQVFFTAYTSTLQRKLFRKPIDGTGEPEVALDLQTHPDLATIDAREVYELQFAGDQVLLLIGAVHGGMERPALLYGPVSALLGDDTGSGGPTDSESHVVAAGGSATLQTTATGTVQWQRNGAAIAGATNASLTLSNIQPADTGIYFAAVTNGAVTTVQPAIVGITTTTKLVGDGEEFPNIAHQNGNIFDQILLKSAAASFTADSAQGQITRLSYVDLTNDIVQVEFSGAGTVSIVLEGATTSAPAANYNQPNTLYLKGHAGIVVTGADETTNLTVFTVGRGTAGNQTLFRDEVTYDGFADISFIAIQSPTGKFGGLRAANASFWNTRGYTGLFAPGIQFNGPVYVHDIDAHDDATPVLMIGSALGNTWITGGDLHQTNDRAVQVAGLKQLHFKDGTTSHYRADEPFAGQYLFARANSGRLETNGVDLTNEIVVNP